MLDTPQKRVRHSIYRPLNQISIFKVSLRHNYRYLEGLAPSIKVAPVLKSNAYGHGLIPLAQLLDKFHPPFFCVDSLYEAYELYKAQIQTPILIMGYVDPRNLRIKELPFAYAVFDYETMAAIHRYQPKAGIHVFVDTGMHREGLSLDELDTFLKSAARLSDLKIEGVMSHLATVDELHRDQLMQQLQNFERAEEMVRAAGFEFKWSHFAASSGLLKCHALHGRLGNVARVGLAMYGIDSRRQDQNLRPILELSTTIAQIKTVERSESIGYDFTFTAERHMKIGVLPIGYYDGVDRRLSNQGVVMVGQYPCPIVGRVSMNITTIDLTAVKNPRIGQKVVIYSQQPNSPNSVANAARVCGTIPYDILVHLAASTRKVVV